MRIQTALLAGLVLLLGCTGARDLPVDIVLEDATAEETAPLAGSALLQRRQQLERAQGDLVRFHETVGDLVHRRDRDGKARFEQFLHAYFGLHLDPLLRAEWQSRHAEVMALDANLRLLKAQILIRLRETAQAERVLAELTHRFRGREDILVSYPIGRQTPLGEALEKIKSAKWKG